MRFYVLFAVLSLGASAAPAATPAARSESHLARPNLWSLEGGTGARHYAYREIIEDRPNLRSTETGTFPVYSLIGRFTPARRAFYVQAQTDLAWTRLTYDGTSQDGSKNYRFDQPHRFFGLESNFYLSLTGQKDHAPDFDAWVYTGLGYRAWSRGESSKLGTHEDYRWTYLPIGARAEFLFFERLHVALDTSIRPVTGGTMTARFSEEDPELDDLELSLGSAFGWRAELPIRFDFGASASPERFFASLSPYYEAYGFGKSEARSLTSGGKRVVDDQGRIYQIHEPESRTSQLGLSLTGGVTF